MAKPPLLHPYIPLLARAYQLSSHLRIGVYDCLYLALMEREGCEFVTGDDKLLKSATPMAGSVVPLVGRP